MSNESEPAARRGVVFRSAEITDLRSVLDVDVAVFGKELAYPYFVLRQLFDLFKDFSVVVVEDGRIVGYALVGVEPGDEPSPVSDVAWLLGLGVVPEARGRGYGKRLLDRALELCTKAGISEAKITVRPTNETAKKIYEKAGFAPTDAEDDYFGPDQPRQVLTLRLEPATGAQELNQRRTSKAKNTLMEIVPA